MIRMISKCWHGEEKLSVVFWVWGVLVGSLISFLIEILWWPYVFVPVQNMRIDKGIESIGYFNFFLMIVVLTAMIIIIFYWIWVVVSIWRCSWNVKSKRWGWIARIVVSLAIILNFINIIYLHDPDISDEDVTVHLSQMTLGVKSLPSQEKWSKIKIGINKEDVISLIGKPPNYINLEDGSTIWQYWSKKIINKEDMKYFLTPWGEVYMVYIDSSGKVYKKSIESIPKPNL